MCVVSFGLCVCVSFGLCVWLALVCVCVKSGAHVRGITQASLVPAESWLSLPRPGGDEETCTSFSLFLSFFLSRLVPSFQHFISLPIWTAHGSSVVVCVAFSAEQLYRPYHRDYKSMRHR